MNLKNDSVPRKKLLLRDVVHLLLMAMVVFLLFKVIFVLAYIPTGSMEPSIKEKSAVIGWRLGYLLSDPIPERGSIVIFDHEEFDEHLVKRVIGLPGDEVCIIEGQVYINGVKLDEPYIAEAPNENLTKSFIVPAGKLFVLGDNRNRSNDSRYWNEPFVEIHDVYAKVIFRMIFLNTFLRATRFFFQFG